MPVDYEIAVAGGGPAGLTAALFAARHGRSTATLEDPETLVSRIEEASEYVEIERLALSPQCGFASNEINRVMAMDEQRAELKLIGDVARRVWG